MSLTSTVLSPQGASPRPAQIHSITAAGTAKARAHAHAPDRSRRLILAASLFPQNVNWPLFHL